MRMTGSKPELLAPAGDMEKLRMAVLFGADAVYLGAKDFSLRAQSKNFAAADLPQAVEFAHAHGVKVYLTVNVYPHEQHLVGLTELLPQAEAAGVDAFIIADPGVFNLAGRLAPTVARHISTQASVTNSEAAAFWRDLGAERVILGREVSLANCAEITRKVPIEVEIFVHGAVCMSYSGRCLLSSYLAGRSANLGDCSQPCRWQYRMEEQRRPGEYMPIEEDKWGAYILNSKDLCLLPYMPEILAAGVSSLKIEGRMKSAYYVANVTRIYRRALDEYWAAWENLDERTPEKLRENFAAPAEWQEELEKVSHRKYFSGFAVDKPGSDAYVYNTTYSFRGYDFAGVVQGYDKANARLQIQQRNHLAVGDEVEFICPGRIEPYKLTIAAMWGENGEERETLPHAKEIGWIACPDELPEGSILRRPTPENGGGAHE